MSTKHTPGPWSVAESRHGYDTVIRDASNGPVALSMIAGYSKECGKANSKLLAAAPDLLSALQECCDYLMSTENYTIARKMQAIVSKVTGSA